jgi:hypothetical protein
LQAPQIEKLGKRIQEIVANECAENKLADHTQFHLSRIIAYPVEFFSENSIQEYRSCRSYRRKMPTGGG